MPIMQPGIRGCILVLVIVGQLAGCAKQGSATTDLPQPSSLPIQDYERILYRWLMDRTYAENGWAVDKHVRDTGPYIKNQYFGTHPAVRIYYSPEVMTWLNNGRKGELPDGAMIVKEMFTPPAVLYQELANHPQYADDGAYEILLAKLVTAWTVMVRDRQASRDGWFWANPSAQFENQSHLFFKLCEPRNATTTSTVGSQGQSSKNPHHMNTNILNILAVK